MSSNLFASLQPVTTTASFADTSPSSILSLLHLPETLIKLNPYVESFTLVPPALPSQAQPLPAEYEVTYKIPYLFGLLSERSSSIARFTPDPQGMLVETKAVASDVHTRHVWTVKGLEAGGIGGGTEVTEASQVWIEGGRVWDRRSKGWDELKDKREREAVMVGLRSKVEEMGRGVE